MEPQVSNTEAEIRDLIARWTKFAETKDIDALMALYADDLIAYDAISALQFSGRNAYRAHWEVCFTYMGDGPMVYGVEGLNIRAAGDVCFAHYLVKCGVSAEHSSWMRATLGCVRQGGVWRIAHEHYSSPFDPQSGKAIFDPRP